MPFNGSGTFTPATSPGYPAVSGTTIASAQFNNVVADVATGLSNTVTRDGQSAPTADLPMGTQKHTGVGDATARTNYPSLGQVQDGTITELSSISGINTITATAPFSMAAYAQGQAFEFVSAGANTGAATLNLNALGAKAITKQGTTALAAGDIASGMVCRVVYDGTRFQLQNPIKSTALASYQPLDGELTALAGLTSAANKVPMFSGSGTATLLDFKDEDNMASNSATAMSSQQAVKAYADTKNIATQVLPATAGNGLFTADGSVWTSVPKITNATAQASTSGSSIDFSSIPSWVKRINLMFVGVSTSGTAIPVVQIGDSGGLETSGYAGSASVVIGTAADSAPHSSGFRLGGDVWLASRVMEGMLTLMKMDGNTWVCSGCISRSDAGDGVVHISGSKTLSTTLDRLSVVTTDTFDAGSINISYE